MPQTLTDNDPMPFGKYKGDKLANVPASYLLYIYDNFALHDNLKQYIASNKDALQQEVKRASQQRNR